MPPSPPTPSPAQQRDADLVAALGRGEHTAAFQGIVERYASKMHQLCVSLLGHEAEAEDAVQEALLRAWRALGSYQAQRGALSTWLYAITRNHCFSALQGRPPSALSLGLPDVQALAEALPQAAPAGPGKDAVACLRQQVRQLPAAQRQCTELYYFEERPVAEVADMLGLPEATVKTHLHRARAALLAALKAAGLGDPQLWL